jgi:hypothetical protein
MSIETLTTARDLGRLQAIVRGFAASAADDALPRSPLLISIAHSRRWATAARKRAVGVGCALMGR